ncbi:MAG: ATP-dependent protease subunit HslV [Deinococcota bacterium]|nr:ATP-dependent protease subunit HslV [Deinococcota bacterium]
MRRMHGTTIVAVHRDGVSAIAGDGQVTLGDTVVKRGAVKVRALDNGNVLTGFAGATADAFTLLEKFESHLSSKKGNLLRAAVETVKEWRTDRVLRNLEAMLIVADSKQILTLTGAGDVVSPDEDVVAVGSGGPYAQAAAVALLRHTEMSAEAIARTAIEIAADIDIYTSGTATVLVAGGEAGKENSEESSDENSEENRDENGEEEK